MHPPRSFAFTEVYTVPHHLPKERAQVSQVHPNPLPDPVRRHRRYRRLPQTLSLTLFEGERPGSTPPDPSRPIHPVPKAQLSRGSELEVAGAVGDEWVGGGWCVTRVRCLDVCVLCTRLCGSVCLSVALYVCCVCRSR